ncbi:DUF1902 domain-containing protein [Enterobacter cloacae]|uniref:type II toxin-antitoxin system HicB family antitoxin n=1 Tax=Enterobacter cloacae TaxID=550 RepID=UPI00315AC518
MRKTFRCMAFRDDGVFVAACLDLSLAAQGETMQEAVDKLDAQIKDYIEEAVAEPAYTRQMLNRKAPLPLWVKYWSLSVQIFINQLLKRSKKPAAVHGKLFREHCETGA